MNTTIDGVSSFGYVLNTVEHDFWKARWQQENIGFHQEKINPHLITHANSMPLGPDARVLVPLAGKTRDMHWLSSRHRQVLGVELVGGQILLITFDYDQTKMDGPPFSVSSSELSSLLTPLGTLSPLSVSDVLKEHPQFQTRGLNQLSEWVYRFTKC